MSCILCNGIVCVHRRCCSGNKMSSLSEDNNFPLASVNYTFPKLSEDPEIQHSAVHYSICEEKTTGMCFCEYYHLNNEISLSQSQ